MIQELVKQWEENKYKLEEYFKTTKQEEYSSSYKQIVTKVFELCLPKADDYSGFDLSKMTVIDDGDYQGTQIFIIPKDTYQPSVGDYVMTTLTMVAVLDAILFKVFAAMKMIYQPMNKLRSIWRLLYIWCRNLNGWAKISITPNAPSVCAVPRERGKKGALLWIEWTYTLC